MKKLLLLLLLATTISIYAQPPGLLNPYILCDNETFNGQATFNLVSTDPVGSNGLDPSVYTVTFHPSVQDANNNVNVITNPSAYMNVVPYSQIIGVRFFNSSTSEVGVAGMELRVVQVVVPTFGSESAYCSGDTISPLPTTSNNGISGTWSPPMNNVTTVYVFTPSTGQCAMTASMTVVVYPAPIANPAALYFCDPMELAIFNLHDADAQITGETTSPPPGVIVTYHETLTDAQTGANPLGPGYAPMSQPIQVLYARVQNPAFGCYSTTTLTLNSHNCTPCSSSAPINLTASNVTDTSLLLSWDTTFGMGNQASLIAVMPNGVPPTDVDAIAVTAIQNQYVITGMLPETCYSIYIKGFCGSGYSQWSEPLNICMPNCADTGACSQVLLLNAFLDSNNNGIKDSGEIDFNQGNFVYQINNSGNSEYGFSNSGYYYILDSNPANSYDISFSINTVSSIYYTSSTTYTNITLPTGSGAHYLYFPITQATPFTDASVNIFPIGQPRPGFSYGNTIMYQNRGNQTIANGTLTFTKDSNISIDSISPSTITTTATGFTYNFTNLAPFETRYIYVYFNVPTIPTVNLGYLLTNNITIQVNNDITPSNDNSFITQTVVGSYDPNDKMESHGGKIVHSTFTVNDYLYYTIQFENTGSANADFVRVEDALDNMLDENSFEMIAASHTVNTKRVGNQLTWHFYNINLPPTSSNPSGSHGYVTFKIKPKLGYVIGDIIPNTASIYFDYNPAIVTNRFDTEFVQALANQTFNNDNIALYPNPTSETVSISNSNSIDKIASVTIYDITGKRIYRLTKNSLSDITIDVSQFARGLYLVELISEGNIKITKKLLLK